MSDLSPLLNKDQLIEVFNFTKTATAIHVGENAVIQMANNAMLQIWGKDRSIIGKSLEDALPELKGQPFIEMFGKVWREGLTLSGSDTPAELLVNGEISTFYFDFEYRALKDEQGKTLCILHTAIDVTERFLGREALEQAAERERALLRECELNEELAAANEELNSINEELFQSQEELYKLNVELEMRVEERLNDLSESEIRFRTMAEGTDILIGVGDETSNAVYFNSAWTELTGRSMDQLVEFGWADLIHPDDKADWLNNYLSAFDKQELLQGEFRVKSRTGDYRWLLAKAPPRFRADGSFAGYISSCVDISERKLDEFEKQKLVDELGAINEELAASNEELLTMNEELANAQEHLKQTFTKLETNENWLKHLIAGAPIAIAVLHGREQIIQSANKKVLEVWGKTKSIIGKPLMEALPEIHDQEFPRILDNVFTSGFAYYGKEAKAVLEKDGVSFEIYLNYVYQPLKDIHGNTEGILITANDVTEQVLSRIKVEEAEVALRLAIEAANFGTWHIHSVTRDFVASDRLKELFGFYPEEKITIEDALAQITAEYRPYVTTALENAISKGGNYDVSYPVIGFHDQKIRWVRAIGNLKADKSGEFSAFTGVVMDISEQVIANQVIQESEARFRLMAEGSNLLIAMADETSNATYFSKPWLTLTGKSMDDLLKFGWADSIHQDDKDIFIAAYLAAFKRKEPFTGEFRILNYRGEYTWLMASATPRFRQDGSFEGYISSCADITELKKDEQRKNDFIGMVSHELKTPLTSIKGYIQMLQRRANETQDKFTAGALDTTNKQVKKMTSMINGFLNISRLESGKIVLVKNRFYFDDLINETIREAKILDSSHQISYEPCTGIEVFADYDKISNVVSNFISNAIKYAPGSRIIEVQCHVVDGMAQLSVKDNGIGIAREDLKNIFTRFYRVENNYNISGFGIGLYLSAEIIDRHGGEIWVESKLGQGSVFYFKIPLNEV